MEALIGDSIRHRTLHGHIVEWLGARIVSGEFPEGTKLPIEAELAARVGVSRGGLREAVKALASKGLVVVRPRVGTVVQERFKWNLLDPQVIEWRERNADDRFIRDLLQLRLIVEPAAVELVAAFATAEEIVALDDACSRMEASAPHLPESEPDFVAADVDFHLCLLRASGNELVAQLSTLLEAGLRHSIETTSHLTEGVERTLPLHRAIVGAVETRDGEAAADAMRSVLATTVDVLSQDGTQGQ